MDHESTLAHDITTPIAHDTTTPAEGSPKEDRGRSRRKPKEMNEESAERHRSGHRSKSRGRSKSRSRDDVSRSRSRDDLSRSKSKESLHKRSRSKSKSRDNLNVIPGVLNPEIVHITLERGERGYGFSLGQHIFIRDMAKESPADKAENLEKGDIVYEVYLKWFYYVWIDITFML